MTLRVGFVGLGQQGLPIAQRIAADGLELHVWARNERSVVPFEDSGVHVETDPRSLGRRCDVVGICVGDDAGVRDVVVDHGLLEALAPGSVIVVHSTVHPDTVRQLAETAAERRVDVLDAPVSGGAAAAADGRLTIMVGGSFEVLDRVRPVLSAYGSSIVHLGGIGAGQTTKIVNNALMVANARLALDALDALEGLDLDRERVLAAIGASSGSSWALAVVDRLFAPGTAGAPMLEKDVRLFAELLPTAELHLKRVAVEGVDLIERRSRA